MLEFKKNLALFSWFQFSFYLALE